MKSCIGIALDITEKDILWREDCEDDNNQNDDEEDLVYVDDDQKQVEQLFLK